MLIGASLDPKERRSIRRMIVGDCFTEEVDDQTGLIQTRL